jgi:hypothetical protein
MARHDEQRMRETAVLQQRPLSFQALLSNLICVHGFQMALAAHRGIHGQIGDDLGRHEPFLLLLLDGRGHQPQESY